MILFNQYILAYILASIEHDNYQDLSSTKRFYSMCKDAYHMGELSSILVFSNNRCNNNNGTNNKNGNFDNNNYI